MRPHRTAPDDGRMDPERILTTPRSPTDRLLTYSLVAAPLTYLLADSLYAANGWDNANAGGIHVLGAILYGFVAVRIASWATGWLQTAAVVAGVLGTAGNVPRLHPLGRADPGEGGT